MVSFPGVGFRTNIMTLRPMPSPRSWKKNHSELERKTFHLPAFRHLRTRPSCDIVLCSTTWTYLTLGKIAPFYIIVMLKQRKVLMRQRLPSHCHLYFPSLSGPSLLSHSICRSIFKLCSFWVYRKILFNNALNDGNNCLLPYNKQHLIKLNVVLNFVVGRIV